MMRPRSMFVAALCVALISSLQTRAVEHGWYGGAAYSSVSPDYALIRDGVSGDTPSGSAENALGSSGFKLIAGYRALDWLAFEADYLDLSDSSARVAIPCILTLPCPNHARADTSSISASTIALWPLGRFDLFARAGLTRWKWNADPFYPDSLPSVVREMHGTDGKFGVGAQFHLRWITARLEYERLRFGADSANAWSLGLAYRFR